MKKNIRTLFSAVALLLVAALVGACSQEVEIRMPDSVPSQAQATFIVKLPGEFNRTRALGISDEYAIQTVDILSFRKNASDNERFFYREKAVFVENAASSMVFSSLIQHSDDAQQFVVLANVRAILDGLNLTTAMTRQQVLDAIVMTQSGAWDVSSDYTPLPMWGQVDYAIVNDGTPELSVEMTRAVGRVDVNIASAAQSDFVLKSVRYYNYPNKGRIAPLDANWNAAMKKVTAPSPPLGGYTYATTASPQTHTVTGGVSLSQTIYSFEAPPAASNADVSSSCLVIGGSWKGNDDTYYRVDFFDGDTGSFLSLLRNYRYDVQITKVDGIGFPDPAEALETGFSNMTAITHVWDEGGMGNVVWDGNNYLSVSQTGFELYPEEQTIQVDVATKYTDGWKAAVSADASDWLSVQGSSKGVGNGTVGTLTLKIDENPTADRTGSITITAGRLKQTIVVLQSLTPAQLLETNNAEFIFSETVGEGQNLLLEWLPATEDCALKLLPVNGYDPLKFTKNPLPGTVSNDGSSSAAAAATLTITPDNAVLGDFKERRSILRISTQDINNTPIIKEVLLRQFDYTLVVSNTMVAYDPSTTYSINVKSNTLWEVVVSNTNLLNIKSSIKGYANYTTGETLTFKTGASNGTITLTFKSKEGLFANKAVKLTIEELLPNSYIVASGTSNFKFNTSNAFRAWKGDRDLAPFYSTHMTGTQTVKLLWQDEPGLILAEPKLNKGVITLSTAPGKEGNAVVALMIKGVIRWNWHIWVLKKNNDPTKNTYTNPNNGVESMNRNIGATLAVPTTNAERIKTFGLLYQHGRKDPFPGASASVSGTTTTKTIYDIKGVALKENSTNGFRKIEVSATKNLINAITNPLVFYFRSSGIVQDWYTTYNSELNKAYHRLDLWPYGNKSYFDPCPRGWRVPKSSKVWEKLLPPDVADLSNLNIKNEIHTDYGYFPATGQRTSNSGKLSVVGQYASLYDSSPINNYSGFRHHITKDGFFYYMGTHKAYGYTVRCVRIQ